ncbi:MAG: TolC family protein, partial [Arcobacteraceae bacterium]
ISMPINFTSINNIERTKLEYLKAQKDAKYAKYEIEINYDIIVEKIRNYEDRIVLAKSDLSLYEELSAITEQEYNLGYKTLDDVSVLRNSMKIRELDIQIYNLNIMKSLLSLYFDILT